MVIQWYPGHMAKTRRLLMENIRLVDCVLELLDARIPGSSRNPELEKMFQNRLRVMVLTKPDLASQEGTQRWVNFYKKNGIPSVVANCKTRDGIHKIVDTVKTVLEQKMREREAKGLRRRTIRLMITGIPNVGKSSLLNCLIGKRGAAVGDKPGITRGKQWIRLANNLELLDTPGILWPKFEDEKTGFCLAVTGAINDDILDLQELAANLAEYLRNEYPGVLEKRYEIEPNGLQGNDILGLIGAKRGFLLGKGEIDIRKSAEVLIKEFRSGKLGRFTLEYPEI